MKQKKRLCPAESRALSALKPGAKILAAVFAFAVPFVLTSCVPQQSEASKSTVFDEGAYVFEDESAQSVTLDSRPEAVFAADDDLLHLWQLAGGEGAVLKDSGELSSCDFLILSPDDDELLAAAQEHSVSCAVFAPYDIDGYLSALKVFTDINGRGELYTYYGSDVVNSIQETIEMCSEKEQKNVCLIDENGDEAEKSFITDILSDVANYTSKDEADVLFVLPGGGTAAGENDVVLIDELFSQYPLERLGEAYYYIASSLYELN